MLNKVTLKIILNKERISRVRVRKQGQVSYSTNPVTLEWKATTILIYSGLLILNEKFLFKSRKKKKKNRRLR